MMRVKLSAPEDRPLQVLCLGCHSDDIEIGAGGTILQFGRENPKAAFYWVVLNAMGPREAEARHAASLFAGAGLQGPEFHGFPDGFMPYVGGDVKAVFEKLKTSVDPDLVLTHNRMDAHQDHRLIAELTWNTFRNHLILEYEIPKYDGDLGQPSVFVPLAKETCQQKVEFLMSAFGTQRSKRWFEPETFMALMRLRGMECNSPSGYAEAFYSRKLVLQP